MPYFYVIIDKKEKTLQVVESKVTCEANFVTQVIKDFNLTDYNAVNFYERFKIHFNGQRDFIDYPTFYKKYSKFKEIK